MTASRSGQADDPSKLCDQPAKKVYIDVNQREYKYMNPLDPSDNLIETTGEKNS